MQKRLNSLKVMRIWGRCNRYCIKYSFLRLIESLATHYVFFRFKHWAIYAHVTCVFHADQIWCFEKILDVCSDLVESEKVLKNGCIYISCSFYSHHLFTEKCLWTCRLIRFGTIFNYVMAIRKNGYDVLLDNCSDFKNHLWNLMSEIFRQMV
jgi:hypothetical protein